MELDPARRAALDETRARALVEGAFGVDGLVSSPLPGAVALLAPDRSGFVVGGAADDTPAHDLMGAALVWAAHNHVDALGLLVGRDAGVHARRAEVLVPRPEVHEVRQTSVAPARATPLPAPVAPHPSTADCRPALEAAGVETLVEHGVMVGEVAGLEVARVLVDGGEARVEVGVGRFDRAASVALHGDRPVEETLARVVAQVQGSRRLGGGHDAVGRLCRERWLRSHLVADPDLVGLVDLSVVEPPIPREGVRHEVVAPAVGVDPADGATVVVVATTGFDPGLVPLAADLVLRHDAAQVVVALPPRDRRAIMETLVGMLPGGRVRAVTPPWDPQHTGSGVDRTVHD